MATNSTENNNKHARLCHIIRWDNWDGYGFNIQTEKDKSGQYIGSVDEGSPAEVAGLRHGDRILEVNGESISDKTHKQVVDAIRELPEEARLLVVDPIEEQYASIKDINTFPEQQVTNGIAKESKAVTLNLEMTAAEFRAKLKEKKGKKIDPKTTGMDLKKKLDILEEL